MVNTMVPTGCTCLKGNYSTAHESLCAKLQQAYTIAEIVAINSELTLGQINRLTWSLTDLLKAASQQCETLKPGDFDSVE